MENMLQFVILQLMLKDDDDDFGIVVCLKHP
jgi:hypothetical protein